MRAMWHALRLILSAAPRRMALGALMAVTVLLAGIGLLGLSGWFITATGLAGAAGIGIAFDVFRPSAGVRFLALGRTAGRYGERLATHDATLRALAALRVDLMRRLAGQGARAMAALRSETGLTRITADVDALDGLVLRLVLPVVGGGLALVVALLGLWWLAGWGVALAVGLGMVPVSALVLLACGRRALAPSTAAEDGTQALRRDTIDTLRDREAVILSGRLPQSGERLAERDAQARRAAEGLDRVERGAAAWLMSLPPVSAALALLAGAAALQAGVLTAAGAAIGVFVALALAEVMIPLRRSIAELGRIRLAAGRVMAVPAEPAAGGAVNASDGAPLLAVDRPDLSFTVAAGEAVALTGPSGAGKTTLLTAIAGLGPGEGIAVQGLPPGDWDEPAFRRVVTMLPQRSALIRGRIRDNLALAAPEAGDDAMWAALRAAALDDTIRDRGGLDSTLGEAGSGLSGGETRRLALARACLARPALLLLDEPTEGLDAATAERVLNGIRALLPGTAILAALHRGERHEIFAGRQVRMPRRA